MRRSRVIPKVIGRSPILEVPGGAVRPLSLLLGRTETANLTSSLKAMAEIFLTLGVVERPVGDDFTPQGTDTCIPVRLTPVGQSGGGSSASVAAAVPREKMF